MLIIQKVWAQNIFRLALAAAAVLAGGASGASAAESRAADGPKRVTVTKQFFPPGEKSGTPWSLAYDVIIYKNPIEIVPGSAGAWDGSTPEAALKSFLHANWDSRAEQILQGFMPGEREKVQKLVSDPELLAKNARMFKNITRCSIVQQVFYGNTRILIVLQETVAGNRRVMDYALSQAADGWHITNLLSEDRMFAQLIEVVRPEARELMQPPSK